MKARSKMILSAGGLKNELWVALGLIILSLLVFLGYLFPGIASFFEVRNTLPIVVFVIVLILLISFFIIIQIVYPVIAISQAAKKIADGDLSREIEMAREDEIGQLGKSLNSMTHRIKESIDELESLGQKTESIKVEINERILVLSNLIEVSHLISQNTPLTQVLEFAINKCLESEAVNLGCIILKDRDTNKFRIRYLEGEKSDELIDQGLNNIDIKLGEGLLGKTLLQQEPFIIDKDIKTSHEIDEFRSLFSVRNAVLSPIVSKGNTFGLLIVGNDTPQFQFSTTETELLQLISKQISIAILNDLLTREVEKLSALDHLTGLYNHTYIHKKLDEAIKDAVRSQQPCSFILFGVDYFEEYLKSSGHIEAENVLIKVADILKETVGPNEKAARFGDHEFAIILPDKNKRQSIQWAEELKRKIEEWFSRQGESSKLTCALAIAENPLDGNTADELISKCHELLKEVMKQGGNRVIYK